MSFPYDQAFAGFEALLSAWRGAHICSVHSYVAVKGPEGNRLLFGRILLEPTRDGVNDTPFQFETEHINAGRFVKVATPESIAGFIAKAKAGQMDTDKGFVSLATDSSGSISGYFAPIYHPLISDGPRLPSLIVHGIAKHNVLVTAGDSRQFDWEMKAADAPFDSLDELLGHCALPTLMQIGDSTTLEIVARTPAVVGANSAINGSEAVIECRFLSYDRISLHQWWVTDPKKHLNPWQAIHQIFDQDLELLSKMLLKPETDKPYAFESAVSTLLTLLGFSVANYGRIPKLQKGPDIIAVTPSGHVGIIECTIGLINENDKLAKLVQRTTLIKEKLADARYGHLQLQSAIVTPLSREEVAADLAAAGGHGIAVVCKQEIENALNRVGFPPNADRMFQDVKNLVPASDQPSLFQK